MAENPLRRLPSLDALVRSPDGRALVEQHGRTAAVEALRAAVADARASGGRPAEQLVADAAASLARPPSLRPVINGTGVIVHTNLGRAPLAEAALARVVDVARGYSTLEYDLQAGRRGSRHDHLSTILAELTGAEAGLAVNNNAAAVLLCLAATAAGGEVVISRGELIEIGDGFRIPDILGRSGARLVEVGTTNRTRAADYERALGEATRAILRVHQSNFRMLGFTERPQLADLAAMAREHDLILIDDLGSGQLIDLPALADEPTARSAIAAGATLVCFSGDKLLGGPQAGVIVGTAEAVGLVKRHPLARALRIDKLSLAALEATLELYRDPPRAIRRLPVLAMATGDLEAVRDRAEALAARLDGVVVESVARIGGGAVPLLELPSFACALPGDDDLAARLRAGDPPVVGRVQEGQLLLDCRTMTDDECRQITISR
ncbi:MAG TPA: L-seryl-tRNA(Sec) selenium transferase [Gaiellales bacterium]|jgi:L-seryl-tRNA(Ser) seleniumtransferase|nr:L-seryl-tRNA(Sec) selenium transferase [Gaiellales bacterium]